LVRGSERSDHIGEHFSTCLWGVGKEDKVALGVLSYRSDGTYGQSAMGSPNWWFDLSSGNTPQISGRSEGAFSLDAAFRGDSSAPQVVEYGQSVTYGSWVCSSEETGMTCRNTETGHGVFLSSARYETF